MTDVKKTCVSPSLRSLPACPGGSVRDRFVLTFPVDQPSSMSSNVHPTSQDSDWAFLNLDSGGVLDAGSLSDLTLLTMTCIGRNVNTC